MSQLDDIAREGTLRSDFSRNGKPRGLITCADGFKVSVIAGYGAYCSPRPHGFSAGDPGRDYEGPYTAVEVGFPSERPEPWGIWELLCDDGGNPTETVYGYVPIETVRALITLHGGESK